jgi:hypothetical protein
MRKRRFKTAVVLVSALGVLGFDWGASPLAQTPQNPPSQAEKPIDQEQIFQELLKKIAGQENKPAEEVFKNVQVLKGVPAGRLLRIMNLGYSRALGVNCAHCHVPGEWDKDDKAEKQVTREMIKMTGVINQNLKSVKSLKSQTPTVNCVTCHRGEKKPALNLQEQRRT